MTKHNNSTHGVTAAQAATMQFCSACGTHTAPGSEVCMRKRGHRPPPGCIAAPGVAPSQAPSGDANMKEPCEASSLSWCEHCGEGVTDFCRGKLRLCPKGLLVPHRNAGVLVDAIDGEQPLPGLILRLHRDGLGPDEIAAVLARLGRDSEADAAGISIRAVIEEADAGVGGKTK